MPDRALSDQRLLDRLSHRERIALQRAQFLRGLDLLAGKSGQASGRIGESISITPWNTYSQTLVRQMGLILELGRTGCVHFVTNEFCPDTQVFVQRLVIVLFVIVPIDSARRPDKALVQSAAGRILETVCDLSSDSERAAAARGILVVLGSNDQNKFSLFCDVLVASHSMLAASPHLDEHIQFDVTESVARPVFTLGPVPSKACSVAVN